MTPLKLGISACLLGQRVRYDGGHKLNAFVSHTLGRIFSLVPVCPEVEYGLSIPREPIQLERDPLSPSLFTLYSRQDLTKPMLRWIHRKLGELTVQNLGGFIFKSKSPSCGLRVRVHDADQNHYAPGLFAGHVQERWPLFPVIEAEQLDHPAARDHFVQNVFLLDQWRGLGELGEGSHLAAFHARHRTLLQTRSLDLARELDSRLEQIFNDPKRRPWAAERERYEAVLLKLLPLKATKGRNRFVLDRLASELRTWITPWEKELLSWMIQAYNEGELDVSRPKALLFYLASKYQLPVSEQAFLRGSTTGL